MVLISIFNKWYQKNHVISSLILIMMKIVGFLFYLIVSCMKNPAIVFLCIKIEKIWFLLDRIFWAPPDHRSSTWEAPGCSAADTPLALCFLRWLRLLSFLGNRIRARSIYPPIQLLCNNCVDALVHFNFPSEFDFNKENSSKFFVLL